MGDYPLILNVKVRAKYYHEFAKLDEVTFLWEMPGGIIHLKELILPMDLDYEPVIQFDEISNIEEKFKVNDKLITKETK